ncbi:MAG: recombinase family protein [Clostridia bacterium]|nr:recombinase family protein [Clostridia bacterium]
MNAVIYARYSSHNQTEQSIEGQLRDNYEYARQQGLTVIAEYIDRAKSGTKDQRADFQRMIEDAAKRQFELIIVWKLDRFARNRYDSAIYKSRLKKYGVRVVSVKESITDNPEGIILEGMLEAMAEYYSANLAQNIRRGIRESIAKGQFPGGPVPYGYKAENKHLVPDDKTAPVIRFVFEEYAAGTSKKNILKKLEARGIRNKTGKPFTITAFQTALSNPVYIGDFCYKGETVPGAAVPLISKDVFDKVQLQLKSNARAPASAKAKVNYALHGKIFCGHCGAPMVGESGRSRNGDKYYYYACAQKKKSHACSKKNEQKDYLERYVVQQTAEYVLSPSRLKHIAAAVVEEYSKEFSDNRSTEYEKALAQIDTELEKLIDALVEAPKIAHAKIYARMEALESQKSDLETELAALRIAQDVRMTESEIIKWLQQFCNGDPDSEEYRSRIIDVFVNSVYVYDDRITIFYNIKGGKQISYIDIIEASPPPGTVSDGSDMNAYAPFNPSSERRRDFALLNCRGIDAELPHF